MDEMFKELGKYMMDVSKYVLTTVLISMLFEDKSNVSLYMMTAFAISAVLLIWGLSFVNYTQEGGKNECRNMAYNDVCIDCWGCDLDKDPQCSQILWD